VWQNGTHCVGFNEHSRAGVVLFNTEWRFMLCFARTGAWKKTLLGVFLLFAGGMALGNVPQLPDWTKEKVPARAENVLGGSFMSVDPVLTDNNTGASFNRYVYANNSPYTYIDPDGRQFRKNIAEAAGVLLKEAVKAIAKSPADAGKAGAKGGAKEGPKSAEKAPEKGGAKSEANEQGGRNANKLKPDQAAEGPHSVIKRDAEGNTTNTATYTPNSKNPTGHDEVKRVDVTGKGHRNPDGTKVETPHVHEAGVTGVRPARPEELPKK
jgi:hypothetical protein